MHWSHPTLRGFTLAVCLSPTACGPKEGPTSADDGTGGTEGNSEGTAGEDATGDEGTTGGDGQQGGLYWDSGTRIRAEVIAGHDGSRVWRAWFDTELDTYCEVVPTTDGYRCLPRGPDLFLYDLPWDVDIIGGSPEHYADPECTVRLTGPLRGCEVPDYVRMRPGKASHASCVPAIVHERGEAYTGTVYEKTPWGCGVEEFPQNGQEYYVGAEVPLDGFVEATVEPMDTGAEGKIARVVETMADGAWRASHVGRPSDGEALEVQILSDDEEHWVLDPGTVGAFYAADPCDEPLLIAPSCVEPDLALRGDDVVAVSGPHEGPVYEDGNFVSCKEHPQSFWDGWSFHSLDATPIPPDQFATNEHVYTSVGGDELQLDMIAPGGEPWLPAQPSAWALRSWFDVAHETPCVFDGAWLPQDPAATVRCVPEGIWSVYYLDSACTELVVYDVYADGPEQPYVLAPILITWDECSAEYDPRIFAIGEALPDGQDLWELRDGACSPTSSFGRMYRVADEIPFDELPAAEIFVE